MIYLDYLESQLFWLIVTFFILNLYVTIFLFPRISMIFDVRKDKLNSIRSEVDKVYDQMNKLEYERNQMIINAIKDSDSKISDTRAFYLNEFENFKSKADEGFLLKLKAVSSFELDDDISKKIERALEVYKGKIND